MRLLRLAHDPERDLVPGVKLPLKLHEPPRVPGRVQHELAVHLDRLIRGRVVAAPGRVQRHHGPAVGALVVDARARRDAEDDALLNAPIQELVLERDAVHLRVRPRERDPLRARRVAGPVDDHGRLGPDDVEAVGEAEIFELVHPHAVVVPPSR